MSADWQQVRSVLESALDLSPETREEFLRKACGGDPELQAEVASLLRGIEDDPSFLEMPAWQAPRENEAVPAAVLAPSDVIGGRYEILKQLGEGGMGTVYQAHDRELDRIVALKVIRPEMSGHPEILRRFKQELILSRKVTHRNVIRIFDLGVAGDRKFITMDFVDGQDLKSLLREKGRLPADQACEIVRQVCFGLQAAHNEGVVHRDLKPQNIMLDASGRAYVMDFGLARSMELAGMTRTGALVGTPAYMSPEQARGEKADARTDLFALGVIFYELLTGKLPYEAETMMATLIRRTKGPPAPPDQLEPALPRAINDIVMKCLQINLYLRYQNAEAIVRDLDRYQSGASPAEAAQPAPELPALEPGSRFGLRYRIESALGEGSMGKVYKAHDEELDRTVALKLIHPDIASNPAEMEGLKRELLLASRLSHKNILRIHDLDEAGGWKFISMAFVEGRNLRRRIKSGTVTGPQALAIARQLTLALEAAHAEGVIHGCLNPENVLLDNDNNVFVSDFGLTKSLALRPADAPATGLKPIDRRGDLYALGGILYELFTGDESGVRTPDDPKLLSPDLAEHVAEIIRRCVASDPARRYEHAREILNDLDRGNAPRKAADPALAIASSRPRYVIAAALAATLVLVIAFSIFILKRRQASSQSRATASKRIIRPSSKGKFVAVLPFRTIGDRAALEPVARGLVEALSANLLPRNDVHLASPAGAVQVRSEETADQVARSLGVKLLVQGSIEAAGEGIRVALNLEDPAARRLWNQVFTGAKNDLITLEDRMCAALAFALDLKMRGEQGKPVNSPTMNAGAYWEYLQGRNLLRPGQGEEAILKQALELFHAATLKDPGFVLAYTALADTYLQLYRLNRDNAWLMKAQGAANHAEVLSDTLPEVHFVLGEVYSAGAKNEEAVAEFKRALDRAPNSEEGYRQLGRAYLRIGQPVEALQVFRYGIEAVPSADMYADLGIAYASLGRYEEARASFEKAAQMKPQDAVLQGSLADSYRWLKQSDKANAAYDRAVSLAGADLRNRPNDAAVLGILAVYRSKLGDGARGLEQIRKARAIDPASGDLLYQEAVIHILANRMPEALRSLDEALANGYSVYRLLGDPDLKAIEQQPDFQAVIKKYQSRTGL